jgi:hypothetical protein
MIADMALSPFRGRGYFTVTPLRKRARDLCAAHGERRVPVAAEQRHPRHLHSVSWTD